MGNKKAKKFHKIEVDRELCIGAATCLVVSPDGFFIDNKNKAVVKPGAKSLSDDEILMAAQSCPTSAIILYDEKGNRIFPVVK